MKRTITELEQKLIDKGFKLHHKTYKGKHSQFVNSYIYVAMLDGVKVKVCLNAKRDTILNYTFENPIHSEWYGETEISGLNVLLEIVKRFIYE